MCLFSEQLIAAPQEHLTMRLEWYQKWCTYGGKSIVWPQATHFNTEGRLRAPGQMRLDKRLAPGRRQSDSGPKIGRVPDYILPAP